jgi:predicted phosphodiesterase
VLIAILADIHANGPALAAVLDRARSTRAQQLVLLGDIVGYGPDPNQVLSQAMELVSQGAIIVQGNHDEAASSGNGSGMNPVAAQAIAWTHGRLNEHERSYLSRLPLTAGLEDILFVHADASQPGRWIYVTGKNAALQSLKATKHRVTFCGHVHAPHLYYLANNGFMGDHKPVDAMPIPLAGPRRWLSVCGSVGQPRDENPAASLTLYDTASKMMTVIRVPYDTESVARRIRAAGLPERLAARLIVGE